MSKKPILNVENMFLMLFTKIKIIAKIFEFTVIAKDFTYFTEAGLDVYKRTINFPVSPASLVVGNSTYRPFFNSTEPNTLLCFT